MSYFISIKKRSIVLGKEVTFSLDGKFERSCKEISESDNFKSNLKINTIWLNSGNITNKVV